MTHSGLSHRICLAAFLNLHNLTPGEKKQKTRGFNDIGPQEHNQTFYMSSTSFLGDSQLWDITT